MMTQWQSINFQMTATEANRMENAIVNIGCTRAEWLRLAIKEFRKLSIEEQIEKMRDA